MGVLQELRVYSPGIGDRIRVVIHYGGHWRPIFWFVVERDGSIYLGPRYINVAALRKGSQSSQDGSATIKYADGQTIDDPNLLRVAKISFHASGMIHAAGDRLLRQSLRGLDEQQLLCHVVFQHLQNFATVPTQQIKKRDVCLRYQIDERRPLQAQFYVAPREKTRLIDVEAANRQMNLVFEYSGFASVPELSVQLTLSHGPVGPWPPATYLVFPVPKQNHRSE